MAWHWHHTRKSAAALVIAVIAVLLLSTAALVAVGIPANQEYQASPQRIAHLFKLNAPAPPPHAASLSLPPAAVTPPPQDTVMPTMADLERGLNQGEVGQCGCYAFRIQLGYLLAKHKGVHLHPSCRFLYALVGKGKDPGSLPEQYQDAAQTVGIVPHRIYDYVGDPTLKQVTYPPSQMLYNDAAGHRYALKAHVISLYGDGGAAMDADIENQLAKGYLVNVDIPVYDVGQNNLLDVTPGSALVGLPNNPNAVIIGYHDVTIVGYIRALHEFIAINTWGPYWGQNISGQPDNTGHAGFFRFTYDFVGKYGYEVLSWHLTAMPSQGARIGPPPPWAQPGPSLDHPSVAPPTRATIKPSLVAASTLYVSHVYAQDRSHYDLAPIINNQAHRTAISPVGLLAVLGGECNLYTHSVRCDHVWGGADVSFGACQVTVQTAVGYGVGNGYFDGYYGPNTSYVRNYENDPKRCITLAATILGRFAAYERGVCPSASVFPALMVAWNAGPGQPCWFLLNPSGQAGQNYTSYLSWLRWSYAKATTKDPYHRRH